MSARTCKTPDCSETPEPTFGWCVSCLLAWGEAKAQPLTVITPAALAPVVDGTSVGHRCGNCTATVPVLVDDVLCLRCDSLLYPSPTWKAAS